MKHIITITTLAYSASAFSANAVAQDGTHEACKKSVEAARAMFRSGVSDAKVPPRVAGYINGMREGDGPQKASRVRSRRIRPWLLYGLARHDARQSVAEQQAVSAEAAPSCDKNAFAATPTAEPHHWLALES